MARIDVRSHIIPWSTTIAALLLNGCVPAVVGGSAVAVHDRRTVGTIIDDQNIEYQVINKLYNSEDLGEESHIKVEAYEGVILLMGETDSEERRRKAAELAAQVDHVERVVNEIQVDESASLLGKANNAWLTTKVNTVLLKKNPVPGFDATRIKVVSSNDTVFLMGLVTRAEGDAVAEVVRNISGVERVVKVFSYMD
jgi:osmotically-inducible protein OsmY